MDIYSLNLMELHGTSSTGKNKSASTELNERRKDLQKVAKEMESLFAYQLVKVMRETAESFASEKKGQGYDTYMSLFDMEISRLFADRGLGLQESMMRWMDQFPEIKHDKAKEIINSVD